jgi:hypothetical protein
LEPELELFFSEPDPKIYIQKINKLYIYIYIQKKLQVPGPENTIVGLYFVDLEPVCSS